MERVFFAVTFLRHASMTDSNPHWPQPSTVKSTPNQLRLNIDRDSLTVPREIYFSPCRSSFLIDCNFYDSNICTAYYGHALKVPSLFYDAFSVTKLHTVDDMTSEWWWIGKDLVGSGRGLILRYYPGISLDGLSKTTKPCDNSRSSGQESNPVPPDYEAGVLTA
jgi:hypothetical protein